MTESAYPIQSVWSYIRDQSSVLKRVAIPLSDVASATSLSGVDVDLAVAELGELGLVSAWSSGGVPSATLTPLAASRLGLKLRNQTRGWAGLVWIPIQSRDPKDRRRASRIIYATDLGMESMDSLPGSDVEPGMIAEARETRENSTPKPARKLSDAALDPDNLPWPVVLLAGVRPWPEGFFGSRSFDGHCPACRGLPLRTTSACLVCDRTGIDWLIRRIQSADARAEKAAKAKVAGREDLV